jgi:ParB/RepB/Spo0J family partition protein
VKIAVIPIDQIVVGKRREAEKENVAALKASIKELGLLNPPTVRPSKLNGEGPRYKLVAGRHRLLACIELGWTEITVILLSGSELLADLAEVDENLCRKELSPLERTIATSKRKAIYEQLHPEVAGQTGAATAAAHRPSATVADGAGRQGKIGNGSEKPQSDSPKSFTADTAEKTGRSERAVRMDVEIGDKLNKKAVKLLEGTDVSRSTRQLKELADLDAEQQVAVAKLIKSEEAARVSEALAALEPDEPEAVSVADLMAESNKRLEAFARKIQALYQDAVALKEPHLHDGRCELLRGELNRAAATVRQAKGHAVCGFCGGKGCKNCHRTGWLNKIDSESAPQK